MAGTYELRGWRRALNALVRALLAVGVAPPRIHLLTVPGRKTGRAYSTPVTVIQEGGQRWLVAPYGEVAWVRNARAAGRVTLSRGWRAATYAITAVPPDVAGPILKRYAAEVPITRSFFEARPDAPVEAFVAEGGRHPVFLLKAP